MGHAFAIYLPIVNSELQENAQGLGLDKYAGQMWGDKIGGRP
jgi:hypothetical protein